MNSAAAIRARACTSMGNVGYGFDVFGLALQVAFDEVTATPAPSGVTLSVTGPHAAGLPADPSRNTAGLAVQSLLRGRGRADGVRLTLDKRTRPGSGLGSSAASAAAAVVAVDSLLGLGLSRDELVLHAAAGEQAAAGAAHTDNVAPAIFGGLTISPFGDDRLPIVHLKPPEDLRLVAALPDVHVVTREARRLLPEALPLAEYSRHAARCGRIIAAIAAGDVQGFGRAVEGSIFEQRRGTLIPGFDEVCRAARAAGAFGVTVSGAGPALVAVTSAERDAHPIAEAMRAAFAAAGVRCETTVAAVGPAAHVVKVDA